MANGGRIDYTIGFNVDKGGLKDLENTLNSLSKMSATQIKQQNPAMGMNEAMSKMVKLRQSIAEVQNAYNKAFDSKLGVLNIEKMQSSLNKLDLNTIQKNFAAIGPKGSEAFLKISQSALTANIRFKETNSLVNKMGTTLINTLKWTFSSSLINRFTGAIQQAVGYVEHLDRSLNDIRIVTKKSADEMEQFGQQANKAAQALGKATTDYTEAALIYYQQGLSDEEVKARAETTLKAANVTGQATKTVSEQLTAVWNGFKVNAEQTEDYVDKLAAVAAISASNLEELSTGMSKVASAASNLGVDIDQLTAQISTIVSVTRQAPESVGTALKTIYARISDLKLGENDEDGLGLGDVSGGLKKLGIEVLDSEGELRDLGTVIEEVAGKWNTWTSAQQAAIAQLMAGKRQYNNLVALFSNWDMYEKAIDTSRNATGELQKQQDIYMESTEAHIQQLKTQWEDLYDSVIDPDAIIGVTDALNGILSVITKIVDAVGGGSTLITGLLGTVLNKFGPQITQQVLMPLINNFKAAQQNAAAFAQVMVNTQYVASQNGFGHEATQAMLDTNEKLFKVWSSMTIEEKNESQELVKQLGYWKEKQNQIEKAGEATSKYLGSLKGLSVDLNKGVFNLTEADQKKAIKELEAQKTAVDNLKTSYLDIQKVSKKLAKGDGTKSKNIVSETELNNVNNKITQIRQNLRTLQNAGVISQKDLDNNYQSLDRIAQRIKDIQSGKGNSASLVFTTKESRELEKLFNTLNLVDPELEHYLQILRKGKTDSEEYALAIEKVNQALNMEGKETKQRVQNVLQTIGAVTQLTSAMQSISNIMQTMGDSTVDAGEKVKSLLSSLIYMVPMLATSIVTLSKTLEISAPVIAGIAIAITSVVGAISLISSIGASARKEAAEHAKNLADASTEVAQAAREEKDAVNELKTSYDALDKTSVTYRDDLRKLLIEHGEFAKAAKVATSSLEELDEMIKQIQEDANNKVIDTSTAQIERLKNAISADINANVLSESERDDEINDKGIKRQTIDLGGNSDIDDIKGILNQYGIDSSFGSGHIDLEQFVNAMVENEAELRKALQENGSDAARRLLEIMGAEQEMLSTTAEALTAKQEAELSNIENNVNIYANGTFEEYDKAFTELKQKANGIFKDDAKAEEWAKKRIAESGAVGTAYAGLSDEVKDIVRGIDKELTVSQLNYLNEHIDLYKAYGGKSAEAFLEGAQEVIDGQGQDALMISVAIALGKDELKDEDISALFANGPLGDLTEGEFRLFNAQKQKRELRKYFSELAAEQEIYNKKTITNYINSLETQRVVLENGYKAFTDIVDKYQNNINTKQLNLYEDSNYINNVQSEYDRLLKQYNKNQEAQKIISQSLDSTDEVKERSLEPLREEEGILKEQINSYYEKLQFVKEISDLRKDELNNDKTLQENFDSYAALTEEIEKQKAAIMANSKELASSIQDIEMLEEAYRSGNISSGDYSERYQQLDRARDIEGLDVEQLENYTDYIQEIAKSSNELADSLEEDGDAADIVAKSIMKMNKGVEELSSNFENWSDVLQHSAKDSQEYLDALSGMRKAMSQLLDISEDYVSSNFLNENLELIGKAAEGDAEAIDSLRAVLAKDVIMNLKLNDESFRDDLLASVTSWQAELDGKDLEVGATLDDSSMIDSMNQMIANAGLTVDQVNALFDSMGFEATFATEQETIPAMMPVTTIHHRRENIEYENGQPIAWDEIETSSTDYIENDGTYTAFSMSTDGTPPKIQSITKKATGSFNNTSTVNKGGNKTSDSGSSGSSKEPAHEDYLEREEDIYREINTELKNIESTLGRIDKVASHSWGEDYQQTLKEQNKLLDQQINKLEEKRDLQKGDLSTRRKQLEDVGVTFAEDGSVMTNAEQVLNELYAGYNAMVTKYNAMSASEQEAYKAQMETEKNRIDAIEKKIGEYESTYSEFQSTLDELLEKHYEAIENEVNQFNNKINVELELSDARKEWNDFWKDVVADVSETDFGGQIAASLKQLKELIGLGSGGQGIVGKLTTHLSKITSEVWAQINSANNGGQDSMFGDDTKLSKETLQEFISKTMSAIQDAEKEVDNIADNYLKTLESAKDIIDAQVDGYETISKHIDHNVNMIKLLDPEDYDALDRQYQRQYENDLNLVKTQRASKEFWQEQMKVHQQMRDSYAKGSKQWETYNKAYKEAVDNYVDATEAFDKAMEDALDKAKEIADNAAEAAYKRLDRSLSNNLSLEVMEDEWKLLNDEADRYYDNVERYLNMEEYTNYLNDAANAIGLSAENQEKLNAFRDTELKKLKEKEKLTEYDIEESKARLEIMKAEMALEDAQRNKSNMRLRRDSQGNYTYQYTADEEAIEDAENGIVTAKKAWYEIVKKRWKDVSQYIIDISKNIVEYQKKYREAKDRGDEEAAAKYLQLIEHQQKDLQLMYSEAAKNQQDLFSGTAQYFANVENAEILPQSEATVRTMVTQWTEGDDSFMGAIQNGIDEINRIQQQYVDDTQKVFEEAGESYERLRDDGIDPTKDSLDALVESQGDLDDNLNQITEDLRDHSEALDDAVRGYEDLKGAAVDAIAEANRALETLAATAIDTKTKVNEAVTASQTAPGIGYNSVAPSSSSSGSGSSTSGSGNSTGSGVRSFVVRESNTQEGVYEARLIPSDKPAGTPDMVSTNLKNIATFLYSKDLHTNSGNWTDIDKNKIPK